MTAVYTISYVLSSYEEPGQADMKKTDTPSATGPWVGSQKLLL